MEAVGSRLRNLRQSRGLSLSDVASHARVSVATLSRIETGKQAFDVDLLFRLAKILRIAASELVAEENGGGTANLPAELAALPSSERAKFWRDLTAAARQQRAARHQKARAEQQVEELLAQVEYLRDSVDDVRRRLKTKR